MSNLHTYVSAGRVCAVKKKKLSLTASKLREDIYRILDEVLESGCPVEIERKGGILRIVRAEESDRLSRLVQRDCIVGDPEDLVHLDWSTEWHERNLS